MTTRWLHSNEDVALHRITRYKRDASIIDKLRYQRRRTGATMTISICIMPFDDFFLCAK